MVPMPPEPDPKNQVWSIFAKTGFLGQFLMLNPNMSLFLADSVWFGCYLVVPGGSGTDPEPHPKNEVCSIFVKTGFLGQFLMLNPIMSLFPADSAWFGCYPVVGGGGLEPARNQTQKIKFG